MSTFIERLLRAAVHAEVAPPKVTATDRGVQASIARSLELSRQTVSYWFKGGEPGTDHLHLIAERWGVSFHWLAKGEGEMLDGPSGGGDLSPEEQDLVQNYRMATPKVRRIISNMARAARKSIVTIAAVIPPLLAPQHSEAKAISHNSLIHITRAEYALRRWLLELVRRSRLFLPFHRFVSSVKQPTVSIC